MSPQKLIFVLMAAVAIIIIGIAAYTFTHFSSIDLKQGIIMIAVGIIGIFLVMGIIIMLARNAGKK